MFGVLKVATPDAPRNVLNEKCVNYTSTVTTFDYGELLCLTDDGVLLAKTTFSMGSGRFLAAAELTRGKLTILDVTPQADILAKD